jgi:hypothetical protein
MALLLMIPLAGCNRGVPTARVEGVVTLDGKPLADIRVLFQPDNKSGDAGVTGSFGLTDAAGKFVLKLSDSQNEGAIVDFHTVTLSDKLSEDPKDSDAGGLGKTTKSRIPIKYTNEPPKFEVKAGKVNQANFELKSK